MTYQFSFSRMMLLANESNNQQTPLAQPPTSPTTISTNHPHPPHPTSNTPTDPQLSPPGNLSETLERSIDRAIHHSLAPRTISNYDSTIEKFSRFCSSHDIPPNLHWPASKPILCAFAASFAETHSGGTAAAAIAALKTHHHQHNMPWHGSYRLTYVLRGVQRLSPLHAHASKRPPVTTDMLMVLRSDLDLSTSHGAAILAIALVAFWSQCRLGELLGSSRLKHNPRRHPSRQDLVVDPNSTTPDLWKLTLPSTKTSFRTGEPVLIARQIDSYDPIAAISRLHQLTPNFAPTSHLFAYICPKSGTPRNITREEFLDTCNQIWSRHGYPRFTGHSFRIGGTTELLAAGTAPDIVKTTGRWSSDSYLKYWRGLDTIAANHIVRVTRSHP